MQLIRIEVNINVKKRKGLIKDKIVVPYNLLSPEEKWRKYLFHEVFSTYRNLIPFSMICSASRGIATGANEFFCFSKSKAILFQFHSHTVAFVK